nr:hypothetical protein [uncultured Mucilaginibacter sp.]
MLTNREFTYSKTARRNGCILGLVATGIGIFGLYKGLIPEEMPYTNIALGTLIWLLLVLGALHFSRTKITITAEAIIHRTNYRTKTLYFDKAKSYRIQWSALIVDPVNNANPTIHINNYTSIVDSIAMHTLIRNRLKQVDSNTYQAELDAVMNDPDIGTSKAERQKKLGTVRKHASYLNNIGKGIAFWLFIYPNPYNIALTIAVLYPFLVLYFVYRNEKLVTLYGEKGDAYPSLTSALFFPAGVLAWSALMQYHLMDNTRWIMPYAIILTGMFVLIRLVLGYDRRSEKKQSNWLYAAIFALLYSYGAMVCVNCNFDNTGANEYKVKVLDQPKHSRRTFHHLTVSFWGKEKNLNDLVVTRQVYQQAKPGSYVTVYQQKGLLGIPWYYVGL